MTNNTTSQESAGATGILIDVPRPHQICLDELKASVPSENASSGTVRLWLLQVLKNRNAAPPYEPAAFVCLWNGGELHTLHPNHIFGFFTNHGLDSDTARIVVADVVECLKDYRSKRAARPTPEREPEQRGLLVDVDTEAQVDQVDGPVTLTAWIRAVLLVFALLMMVALGVLVWYVLRVST